ncbi:probable polygalacturonase At1g80170 isoform X1 [Brassica napus]|uniref:probable polygalacturonase At1g80170 isoform X1 n=1 Tax=Brassica napus TaxID=3708 RepID=UPI000BBE80A3|nr:probable polygalacturonase At1g80170 isoform X1 [Brassica napus]
MSYLCSIVVTRLLLLVVFSLSLTASNANSFESFLQLPRRPLRSTRTRPRSERLLHVGHFGAKGNGFTDDTKAFEDAWKTACSSKGKTRVLVPENYTSLVRPIDLSGPCKARLTLQISGTIIAPDDPDAWEGLNPRKWLYFHSVSRFTVEGGGTVNGMGQEWWRRSCKHNHSNVKFASFVLSWLQISKALTFHKCKNMRVENLSVIDSQQMHIAFTSCRRVTVSALKVIAPGSSPNTDGIHISASRGIVVDNSTVSTGDDCVSIVKNSSQISISNIICGPGHGISIGSIGKSKSWEEVKDVTVDTAFISDTANGVRIKTWQGGSGLVSKIIFRNINMNNVSNPIIIDQYYCDSKKPCANQTSAVSIEKISFVNVHGTSATKQAIKISCSDAMPCRDIVLQDIDLEPSKGDGYTESFCWEAYGSSSGQVYPPSCLSGDESFLEQSVRSGIITSVSYL